MALATQCPHCFTTFRVASDQLKLRGGLVRCGSCKQVFNGEEYLVQAGVSDGLYHPAPGSKAQDLPAVTVTATAPPPSFSTSAVPEVNVPAPAPEVAVVPAPASAIAPEPIPLEAEPKVFRSPSTPGYIPDLGTAHKLPATALPDETGLATQALPPGMPTMPTMPTMHDGVDAVAEPVLPATEEVETVTGAEPADDAGRDAPDDESGNEAEAGEENADADPEPEPEAPGFVQRAERRERLGNAAQIAMIVLSAVLIPALLLQATYYWRNQIAAAVPAMRPMLTGMCETFHCTVGLPADIDRLSLESNELQVVPPNQNIYALSLVLRNRDSGPQAWPAIELTLNNDDEKPVVRRVFRPREYLGNAAKADAGLAGQSEQQLKIVFELDNALVSGYRIYLFYP